MAVSELPGNPNAVWTVKKNVDGNIHTNIYTLTFILMNFLFLVYRNRCVRPDSGSCIFYPPSVESFFQTRLLI